MDNNNATPCSTADPDLWFSDRKRDKAQAIAICGSCPFQTECRQLGDAQEFGIWGGVEAEVDRAAIQEAERQVKYAEVLDLYRTGVTNKTEIARQLGVPRTTVNLIIKTAA